MVRLRAPHSTGGRGRGVNRLLTPLGASHAVTTRDQRLAWARGVRMEMTGHSDARIRRACRIFIAEATTADYADRVWAHEMLRAMRAEKRP